MTVLSMFLHQCLCFFLVTFDASLISGFWANILVICATCDLLTYECKVIYNIYYIDKTDYLLLPITNYLNIVG